MGTNDSAFDIRFYSTPAFRRKGVLWFHHWQYVSMPVGKREGVLWFHHCQYVSMPVGKREGVLWFHHCQYVSMPVGKREGVLWFHHCQYVSMPVGKRVFSKTAHRTFLKLLIKLGCLEAKISFWGIMPKKTPKIVFSF